MNVNELFTDDNAVSPVIGVILMVAITVILAAVIGAFVLNIGGSQQSAPQATIEFTNTSSGIEVAHQSGDPLSGNQVTVKAENENNGNASKTLGEISGISDKMTAGDSFMITGNDTNLKIGSGSGAVEANTEVQIVWDSPSSDKSSIIASYETS